MEKTPYEIHNKLWNSPYDDIVTLMNKYQPSSDKMFQHPILHEISHQAGNDPNKPNISKDSSERFKRQNEIFKFLWMHPKMRNLWFNDNYRDKYGYTAIERMRVTYNFYNDDLKLFIKENICPKIEETELISLSDNFSNKLYMIKNIELFGKLNN